MFRKRGLAVVVASKHPPQLRHAHVAFVHEQNGVFRQVFEQRGRRISRLSTREVTGIVLDSRAVAGGFQHFQIDSGAFLQSLRFQELAVRSEPLDTIFCSARIFGIASRVGRASHSGCWDRR